MSPVRGQPRAILPKSSPSVTKTINFPISSVPQIAPPSRRSLWPELEQEPAAAKNTGGEAADVAEEAAEAKQAEEAAATMQAEEAAAAKQAEEEAATKQAEEAAAAAKQAEEEAAAAKQAEEEEAAAKQAEEEAAAAKQAAEEAAAAKQAAEEAAAAAKQAAEAAAAAKQAEEERLAAENAERERIAAAEAAKEEEIRNRPRLMQLAIDEERLATLVSEHGHRVAEVQALHRQREYLISQTARSPLHRSTYESSLRHTVRLLHMCNPSHAVFCVLRHRRSNASALGSTPVVMRTSPRNRQAAVSPARSGAVTPERSSPVAAASQSAARSPMISAARSPMMSGALLSGVSPRSARSGGNASLYARAGYAEVSMSPAARRRSPRDSPVVQQYTTNAIEADS
eukprot:COSAG03_NODE_306_length_9154_cov_7.381999_1_plen_398_part_10